MQDDIMHFVIYMMIKSSYLPVTNPEEADLPPPPTKHCSCHIMLKLVFFTVVNVYVVLML